MRKPDLEETYFLIQLKGNEGEMLSLQEGKKLSEDEYHPIDVNQESVYRLLVETQAETGNNIPDLGLFKEPYKDYKFESVFFPVVNDCTLDGFLYDKERGVVFYGNVYGLYAVERDNAYYDVITDEEIPIEAIDGFFKRETLDDFMEMVKDLKIIGSHRGVYLKVVEEEIRLLKEGVNNRKIAHQRYRDNYNQAKRLAAETEEGKEERRMRDEAWKKYEESEKAQEMAIDSKRREASQLIYQIRNNIEIISK